MGKALISIIAALAALLPVPSAALATSATYAIDVSPSGPVQAGMTVTLTPIVNDVSPGTAVRCFMGIQRDDSPYLLLRMQVASDGCEPWVFKMPPTPSGTYTVFGRVAIDVIEGHPSVWATDSNMVVTDGGTAVDFTTNYPVQSWDLADMISTSSPHYGEDITIKPPTTADGCQLRILGGFEYTVTNQWSDCQPWTFSIPERTAQGPLTFFEETSDARIIAWSGVSQYSDVRPDAGYLGAKYGETYNTSLANFTPGTVPGTYTSNIPAIFVGLERAHVQLAGDPNSWSFAPVVVGTSAGTCGFWGGDDYEGPSISPVVAGGCEDAVPVPPWLESSNAERDIFMDLLDEEGAVVSTSQAQFGFVLPMADVVLDNPATTDPGTPVDIDASTDEGVPASYEIVAELESSGFGESASTLSSVTPIASGYFQPSLGSPGGEISVQHAFPTPGRFRITATFTDVRGETSTDSSVIVVGADSVPPTATVPTNAFVANSTLTNGKVPTRFAWTGTDAGTGVASYRAALSTDGGGFVAVGGSLTQASLNIPLASGHSYRLRVRAIDNAGNQGVWVNGPTFRVAKFQESAGAFTWAGSWLRANSSKYWAGHERHSHTAGNSVTFITSARSLAWIGSVGPSRGVARIYVNDVLIQPPVNLSSASTAYRRLIASLSWSSAATRTIKIVVNGTAGHSRVNVDAFVTGT